MLPTIDKLLVDLKTPLSEVLQVIDTNAQGICFVVDDSGVLHGTLTDGDIRRALLRKESLESTAQAAMFKNFISKPIDTPREELLKLLSPKIRHIPLIDSENKVVDYACFHRYNRFPVSEPLLEGNELDYVMNCVKTNWISSAGKYVRDFEQMVGAYCDMPYALAVSNGTVALHLALDALGIGEGDEVIVPNLTFAASVNSIIYTGATPVLVDVEADTWNIDPNEVEKAITPKTKAIMPVHLYGLTANMNAISEIAEKHNLLIVEDAAEAIGSEFHGKRAGSFGDAATFSFYGNKTITTGEGGMVLFKKEADYQKAAVLRDHGMSKQKRYWHEYVGYNYRLTNLQAAIGVAQMERIDSIIERKIIIADRYLSLLSDVSDLVLPARPKGYKNTYWLFTVLINEKIGLDRDNLIKKLQMNSIETRPVFYPMHKMPPYTSFGNGRSFSNSENISRTGICLPSYLGLKNEEIDIICDVLKQQLKPVAHF